MHLNLYTRSECPLCDEAAKLALCEGLKIVTIDITQDLQLLSRFRDSIPVLEHSHSGDRLGWPFDSSALKQFVLDHTP